MSEWWSDLEVLPASTGRDDDGMLRVAGVRLDELARVYGTPVLVIDEAELRQRAREYRAELGARWPDSAVVFASKAFPCTAVMRTLAQEGVWVDVATGGELALALAAGVEPAAIVMHGNARTDEEMVAALTAGVAYIVIDGWDDVERLRRLRQSRPGDSVQPLLVRVIPDVAPDTHPAISTGGSDSKFGLPVGQALRAITALADAPGLRVDGVHLHIGSQILDAAAFGEAVTSLATQLHQAGAAPFAVYNLGGGLGIDYTRTDHAPSLVTYLDTLVAAAKQQLPRRSRILIEPGRSLVGRAGITLYTAVTVKRTGKVFVAVDGGMGDNLEPALYNLRFEALLAARGSGGDDEVCDVVGRHCESGDRLVSAASLPRARVGDLVVIPGTGAYTFSLSNNYNGSLRPPVVFARQGQHRAVVRRETMQDLMARDLADAGDSRAGEAVPARHRTI